MVFGGTYEKYSQKSNCCMVLSVESEGLSGDAKSKKPMHKLRQLEGHSLPNREAFWSQQAIIEDGKIFALQNMANEVDESNVYLDKRMILMHNGQGWHKLS